MTVIVNVFPYRFEWVDGEIDVYRYGRYREALHSFGRGSPFVLEPMREVERLRMELKTHEGTR